MNSKINKNISDFATLVLSYIRDEYSEKYYKYCKDTKNYKNIHSVISAYYFGGNNVPDTAGDIVIELKRNL